MLSMEETGAGFSNLIEAFSKVHILLIDDIGMEYDGSGFTTKTLCNICVVLTLFSQDQIFRMAKSHQQATFLEVLRFRAMQVFNLITSFPRFKNTS
jgi:hypothetical protein